MNIDQQNVNGTKPSPYAELFRDIVKAAHKSNASDIHIEPTRDGVDIRFRVYGEMRDPWKKLGPEHRHSFFQAIKRETRLTIGVAGRPQDSRCNVAGVPVDLRVNLLPTIYGEKIVLRLLDSSREFGIDALGIPKDTLAAVMKALDSRNGVVLMSGPTGSGKTTTLYSMLCAIDRTRKNIITLEDPVEYTIHGINQVKVDGKVSFSSALRAVLRQDPDVILVGEIRDEETASLAFKAAATGHLVLSTVHANGAREVAGRLLGLGLTPDTLRDNLRFSAAQRLVGRLCEYCATPAPETLGDTLTNLLSTGQKDVTSTFKLKHEPGCSHCNSGITGRLPLIEYADESGIRKLLETPEASGERTGILTKSLKEAAFEMAARGLIDAREVMDVR